MGDDDMVTSLRETVRGHLAGYALPDVGTLYDLDMKRQERESILWNIEYHERYLAKMAEKGAREGRKEEIRESYRNSRENFESQRDSLTYYQICLADIPGLRPEARGHLAATIQAGVGYAERSVGYYATLEKAATDASMDASLETDTRNCLDFLARNCARLVDLDAQIAKLEEWQREVDAFIASLPDITWSPEDGGHLPPR